MSIHHDPCLESKIPNKLEIANQFQTKRGGEKNEILNQIKKNL